MMIAGVIFDAYGTLFDVQSVSVHCEKLWPGQGVALSRLWRAKQLEYSSANSWDVCAHEALASIRFGSTGALRPVSLLVPGRTMFSRS